MKICSYAALVVAAMLLIGTGRTRETAPQSPAAMGQTFVTRESLEPDKLASIWLVKRHVDKEAR